MLSMPSMDSLNEAWRTPRRLHNALRLAKGELDSDLASTAREEVAHWGRVTLNRYAVTSPKQQCPILMIPSVINRNYVLDLRPGQSYIEYLGQQGIPVYMIDWGDPGPQDRYADLAQHVLGWIDVAVRAACRDAGVEAIHLLGYCVGGTMSIAYTALRPRHVAGLVALTAPVKFQAGEAAMSDWARNEETPAELLDEELGLIPGRMLQSSFLYVQPMSLSRKLRDLAYNLWDDAYLERFLALETWINDPVDLPGPVYRSILRELYQEDRLASGTLVLRGETANLSNIHCPVLTAVSATDHIVPDPSARVLHDLVGSKDTTLLDLPGGHIGITVGRHARDGLWAQSRDWLMARPCPVRDLRTH